MLSPDGKWLLTFHPSSARQLKLLPTGPGEVKRLPETGIEYQGGLVWFPDGICARGPGARGTRPIELSPVGRRAGAGARSEERRVGKEC